jgi:hypothetical protein
MTRFDPRKVSLHKSYTLKELTALVGMSQKTCLRWIEQGLPTVPGCEKPILIKGSELKEFIRSRNSKPELKLKRHEFFCLTCKDARRAKRGSLEVSGNTKKGKCSVCNGKVSKTIHPLKKDYYKPSTPTQMSIFT